ncbi:hypothetical protein BOX15_Mlig020895g1, partial [Macrostomum lignano]
HCLAVELPGHGGSLASSAEEFDLEPLARRVRSLVCAAGYEKQPMHVIGYSMGACVAGAYAALYPEQADLLTVAAPLMRQPSATEEANTELLHRLSSWLAPASYDELTVALRHRAYRPVPVASQVLTGMLEDRLPKLEFHELCWPTASRRPTAIFCCAWPSRSPPPRTSSGASRTSYPWCPWPASSRSRCPTCASRTFWTNAATRWSWSAPPTSSAWCTSSGRTSR